MEKVQEDSHEPDINEQILKIDKKITKRKRKQTKEEDETKLECSICFGFIEDKGQIEGCEHAYCFKCIEIWAEKHQTCPQCRKQFKYINRVWKQGNRKRQKKYIFENEASDISDDLVPVENIFRWIAPVPLFHPQMNEIIAPNIIAYAGFLSNSLAYSYASDSE